MNTLNKLVLCILGSVIFIFGVDVGIILKHIPLMKFDGDVKIFEVLTFLLTLVLGTVYPFLIKKWIEDNRFVKNSLVEELNGMLGTSNKVKEIVEGAFYKGKLSRENKDSINIVFNEIELQVSSFKEQLEISFPKESKAINENLFDAFNDYWRETTGGDMMSSKFKMDERFYQDHAAKLSTFQRRVKTLTHKIYAL